jgi:urease alpha subunit
LRDGQGQTAAARNDVALDTILTNVVIIDAVAGVLKADVGLKDGMIAGVGKGGNPHTMECTPGLLVGVGTDVVCGEGLLLTAGGVDMGACFAQSKASLMDALASGLTTLLGGGTGSLSSGRYSPHSLHVGFTATVTTNATSSTSN